MIIILVIKYCWSVTEIILFLDVWYDHIVYYVFIKTQISNSVPIKFQQKRRSLIYCTRRFSGITKSLKIPKGQSEAVFQKKKYKRTNIDLQSTTQKTRDWEIRTPLKHEDEPRCSGSVNSSCSTRGARHINLVTNPVISHE